MALVVVAVGCSSSGHRTAPSTTGKPGIPAAASDQVTAIAGVNGGSTTLDLAPSLAATLTSVDAHVAGSGTARLGLGTVRLPITTGYIEVHADRGFSPGPVVGSIQHDGSGITLATSTVALTFANVVLDPGDSVLDATVIGTTRVPFLAWSGAAAQVSRAGVTLSAAASLTPTAAAALDQVFATGAFSTGMAFATLRSTVKGTQSTFSSGATIAELAQLSGDVMTLDLDSGTQAALARLRITTRAEGTAQLVGDTLAFPITGGTAVLQATKTGSQRPAGVMLDQGSGLTFVRGDISVTAHDLVVNPGTSTVDATVGYMAGLPLFSLVEAGDQIAMSAGTWHLDAMQMTLTPLAANALNQAFGVSSLRAGMVIGVVHLILFGSAGG